MRAHDSGGRRSSRQAMRAGGRLQEAGGRPGHWRNIWQQGRGSSSPAQQPLHLHGCPAAGQPRGGGLAAEAPGRRQRGRAPRMAAAPLPKGKRPAAACRFTRSAPPNRYFQRGMQAQGWALGRGAAAPRRGACLGRQLGGQGAGEGDDGTLGGTAGRPGGMAGAHRTSELAGRRHASWGRTRQAAHRGRHRPAARRRQQSCSAC